MKALHGIAGLMIVGQLFTSDTLAQGVSIGSVGDSPDASALLDLNVSGMADKKGILIPRMTEGQKLEILNPATGLLVFQTDNSPGFNYYDGTQWRAMEGDDLGGHTAQLNIDMNDNWISGDGDDEGVYVSSTGNVGIGVEDPQVNVHALGPVRVNDLSGSGSRMVVADANGQLTTQPIPSAGPGAGTTLYLNVTNDISNVNVAGVSFIHVTSDNNNNEVDGLTGGIQNQVIYLINTSNRDLKFNNDSGTQQFLQDFDLKKEEGGMIMFSGSKWHVISKH